MGKAKIKIILKTAWSRVGLGNRNFFWSRHTIWFVLDPQPTMESGRAFVEGSGSTEFSFTPQQCPGKTAITAYKTKNQTTKLVGLQFRCGSDVWLDPIGNYSGSVWSGEHEFQCPGQNFIQMLVFKMDSGSLSKIGAQCKNGDFFVYITATLYSRMDNLNSPGANKFTP